METIRSVISMANSLESQGYSVMHSGHHEDVISATNSNAFVENVHFFLIYTM